MTMHWLRMKEGLGGVEMALRSRRTARAMWVVVAFVVLLELSSVVTIDAALETIPLHISKGTSEPKYNVVFLSGEPPEGVELISMRSSATGEEYKCALPSATASTSTSTSSQENAQEEPKQKIKVKTPKELLSTMKACIYRVSGWWTYEFCKGSHVRQFHQEEKAVVSEFFLGRELVDEEDVVVEEEEEDEDEENPEEKEEREEKREAVRSDEEDTDKDKHKGGEHKQQQLQYSETYVGGTYCELTGKERVVTVHYFCHPGADRAFLADISEPSTCNYLISVSAPALCKHPDYRPDREHIVTIDCYLQPPST